MVWTVEFAEHLNELLKAGLERQKTGVDKRRESRRASRVKAEPWTEELKAVAADANWDGFVACLREPCPLIHRVAIVAFPDGFLLSQHDEDNSFKASEAELQTLVGLFEDVQAASSLGVDLEDVHYIVPHVEDDLIFGRNDNESVLIIKTTRLLLIAIFESDRLKTGEFQPAPNFLDVGLAVRRVARHLIESDY